MTKIAIAVAALLSVLALVALAQEPEPATCTCACAARVQALEDDQLENAMAYRKAAEDELRKAHGLFDQWRKEYINLRNKMDGIVLRDAWFLRGGPFGELGAETEPEVRRTLEDVNQLPGAREVER